LSESKQWFFYADEGYCITLHPTRGTPALEIVKLHGKGRLMILMPNTDVLAGPTKLVISQLLKN
jgi:hypothetical protein